MILRHLFQPKMILWFYHWSSQFGGICRLDHLLLQIINKGVNKTVHRYLRFMTTYGAPVPPAYLPDSTSFSTSTWVQTLLFFVTSEVPLHITQKHLLFTLDRYFLTCPPNSWFRRILLPCWPDCWQGCWQGYLLLTRMFLPHFLRWILSLYTGVLSAQSESHGHKS